MEFDSTIYIQVQTWGQVTEVYSIQLSIKIHVFPTFITGYNVVTNGTKFGPLKRTFDGVIKHRSQRCHLSVI